ncbi:MAG: hypothetical protein RIQ79_1418 [Verrucomicrobiota bacterium]|jgi:hypothetical protein
MSVTELQDTISRLSPLQKRAVTRYINYLMAEDAPATVARRRRITRVMKEMDAGKTLTLEQVRRLRAQK